MPTAFVTGAGRGLGAEFARQYAAEGWEVIATLRDPRQGKALIDRSPKIEVHLLDLRERPAILRLVEELKGRPIDVLLNVAGVYIERGRQLGAVAWEKWHEAMAVNVFAPYQLAASLADNVAMSRRGAIVNFSSRMGSIAENPGGEYVYRSTKAALNLVTTGLAGDLRQRGVTVIAVHPGWAKTDMGGPGATIPVAESARRLRELIGRLSPSDSSRFYNYDGREIPW